MFAIELK